MCLCEWWSACFVVLIATVYVCVCDIVSLGELCVWLFPLKLCGGSSKGWYTACDCLLLYATLTSCSSSYVDLCVQSSASESVAATVCGCVPGVQFGWLVLSGECVCSRDHLYPAVCPQVAVPTRACVCVPAPPPAAGTARARPAHGPHSGTHPRACHRPFKSGARGRQGGGGRGRARREEGARASRNSPR